MYSFCLLQKVERAPVYTLDIGLPEKLCPPSSFKCPDTCQL